MFENILKLLYNNTYGIMHIKVPSLILYFGVKFAMY